MSQKGTAAVDLGVVGSPSWTKPDCLGGSDVVMVVMFARVAVLYFLLHSKRHGQDSLFQGELYVTDRAISACLTHLAPHTHTPPRVDRAKSPHAVTAAKVGMGNLSAVELRSNVVEVVGTFSIGKFIPSFGRLKLRVTH
jgi:hypothetical protein